MEEKNTMKWYNKVGYGSGDRWQEMIVYAFLSSFVMLYLTNTVGFESRYYRNTDHGYQKLFDGISDMFFWER